MIYAVIRTNSGPVSNDLCGELLAALMKGSIYSGPQRFGSDQENREELSATCWASEFIGLLHPLARHVILGLALAALLWNSK
jgi:hypothetical protein